MKVNGLTVWTWYPCCDGVVVVLWFYVPPTAKVIRRQDLGLKSHPKDRCDGVDSGDMIVSLLKKTVEFHWNPLKFWWNSTGIPVE